MEEFEITTQGDIHRSLPAGEESEWVVFASFPVVSGKMSVSDPMFFRDLPPPPTFAVGSGSYQVQAKVVTYPGDKRVSRLRAVLEEPSSVGPRLGYVGVDFAQVTVFDPVVLNDAAENLTASESERLVDDLDAIREYGAVRIGADDSAIMPVVSSGFGDGRYPIHELLVDGKRVGLEVIFIGNEVLAGGDA